MSKLSDRYHLSLNKIIADIDSLKHFAHSLPESNKNKLKYINTLSNLILPISYFELNKKLFIQYSNGIVKEFSFKKMQVRFSICRKQSATISNLIALRSGKKQIAVLELAKQRRMEDGSFRGIDKTTATKLKLNINSRIAHKVSIARRLPNGEYKGISKMCETKRKNNTFHIASLKTAQSRRLPNGDFKGAYKTSQTRRQQGFLSTRYGRPCIYQHKDGTWILLRSMWEWCYAYHLDNLSLDWQYEPCRLMYDRKAHIPDFYVNGIGYVEIKPSCYVSEELCESYLNEYNIKVITEKDSDFLKYYSIAKRYRTDVKNKILR